MGNLSGPPWFNSSLEWFPLSFVSVTVVLLLLRLARLLTRRGLTNQVVPSAFMAPFEWCCGHGCRALVRRIYRRHCDPNPGPSTNCVMSSRRQKAFLSRVRKSFPCLPSHTALEIPAFES